MLGVGVAELVTVTWANAVTDPMLAVTRVVPAEIALTFPNGLTVATAESPDFHVTADRSATVAFLLPAIRPLTFSRPVAPTASLR